MGTSLLPVTAGTSGAQQKDNLCGPFWAARVLNERGFSSWSGEAVDSDLIALRAGTTLPETSHGPDVPPGAVSLTDYRYELPTAPAEESGTSAPGLARAIEAASTGKLRVVPLRGGWTAERVERLVDEARELDARLIANLRTGRLWGGRPAIEVLLGELEGESVQEPAADWDVGHFAELEMVIHGPKRSLVVVHDTYPSLGWAGRHLQPPRAVAAALLRGDGREGGVLAVVPEAEHESVKALARKIGLDIGDWDNGSRS